MYLIACPLYSPSPITFGIVLIEVSPQAHLSFLGFDYMRTPDFFYIDWIVIIIIYTWIGWISCFLAVILYGPMDKRRFLMGTCMFMKIINNFFTN